MPAHAYHKLNQAEINRILRSPVGAVARDMMRRGIKVQTRAKLLLSGAGPNHPKRVASGLLRGSVYAELVYYKTYPGARVGSHQRYALMVHNGTGLWGPRHTPIRPVAKKALRWRAAGQYVFAKKSSGMRGNPHLVDALPAARG